jgi:hypothetical protein
MFAGAIAVSSVCFADGTGAGGDKNYEIGGPLEGIKLPLYKTQHGEPPGYPGVLPGKETEGVYPEFELFPGSPERFHSYMHKYVPMRSMLDAQSLLHNWKAEDLAQSTRYVAQKYAAPLYWIRRHEPPEATGLFNAPVKVIRTGIETPVFKLDLGELPMGMYCLKTVGAVETKDIQQARKALYYTVRVNDGLAGEVSTYRQRIGYVDELFSVSEVYFHAPQKRHYTAELFVDAGSRVELLVHNIELHDVLTGSVRRAIKTRATFTTPQERAALREATAKKEPRTPRKALTVDARLQQDAAIWNSYPRINYQSTTTFMQYGVADRITGAAGKNRKEIEAEYGAWRAAPLSKPEILMENEKLGLQYSMQDAAQQKPLPDPYPFKDDGAGIQTPPATADGEPQNWQPVGDAMYQRVCNFLNSMHSEAEYYHKYGDNEAGRDAALRLIRFAYDLPSSDNARMLHNVIEQPGGFGRDSRHRWRDPTNIHLEFYANYPMYLEAYDRLFDIIANDKELVASVSRFVPWVKTNSDLVQLMDVYLVQEYAKRVLRYQWNTGGAGTIPAATVLGDRSVTDPWMEWLFTKNFSYPLPPSGTQDLMITGYDRSGTKDDGSSFYSQGEAAYVTAQDLEGYVRSGGNPKFDLSNAEYYPKPLQSLYWQYQILVGGLQFLRIGDVTGPDKGMGATWNSTFESKARLGWCWSKDPNFAFLIKHYFGRKSESDEEWQQIEAAAATVKRAPFLNAKSRVLPQWASILESGTQHDDFRFRRAAYLRVGQGWGHHHDDTLDLQVVAHGLPMTLDGGQRIGYSKPADVKTRVHNLVEVDGEEMLAHSWVNALSDASGARYTRATLVPPENLKQLKHYSRQVALLDVDEGVGSKPLPPSLTQPTAKLDPVEKTANSYVFDVVRVDGGKQHTLSFHGPVSDPDQDQPRTNARDVLEISSDVKPGNARVEQAAKYLDNFTNRKFVGVAPDTFQATFQVPKVRKAVGGIDGAGTEPFLMGSSYDPKSPDKFVRLHVLGMPGATVMKGDQNVRQWKYFIPFVFVQKQGAALSSAFVSIIEPFAGTPFIKNQKLLAVTANESDALKAVAVAVETTNGHRDLNFADGRPQKVRVILKEARIAGEFAYVSTDGSGLRQASLTGGTMLSTPQVLLQPALRERTAKVTKVDFPKRTMWIDGVWPKAAGNSSVFEIGTPEKKTQYTAVDVAPQDKSTRLRVEAGADFYQSRVREVDAQKGIVVCSLGFANFESNPQPGQNKGWFASNESMTKFWRAEYLGGSRDEGRYSFRLTGGPLQRSDFGPNGALRLWEYGVGDTVRQSTFASLQRVQPNVYEVQANVACRIGLVGNMLSVYNDGKTFRRLNSRREGKLVVARISEQDLGTAGKLWLRVSR